MSILPNPFKETKVPDSWSSLHDALSDRAPQLLTLLTKGPGKVEQDAAEAKLGYALPKSVRAYFYFLTPKDSDEWIYLFLSHPKMNANIYAPLSIQEALQEREVMLDVRNNLSPEERSVLPADNASFHGDWFHPSWLPIARSGGGDFLVVELDPPPGGRAGQVIEMHHDESQYFLVANDLSELLNKAEKDLLAGSLDKLIEDIEEDALQDAPPPLIAEETALGSLPDPPARMVDNTPDGTEPLGDHKSENNNSRQALLLDLEERAGLLLGTAETMPDIIHQDQFAGIGVRILQTDDKLYVAFRAGPEVQVNNWITPMRDAFFPGKELNELRFSSALGMQPLILGELALECDVE